MAGDYSCVIFSPPKRAPGVRQEKYRFFFCYDLGHFLRRHFLRILVAFLRILCAFLRILCIFGALGQMQWMHRPADRASRPGVAKYRNAAFVVHFTCIYVHLRTRMQNACRMHVNLHKMALAKLQVHSPDAILPRSSPDHPSPASECHPDRHRGRWLRMHMDALRVHRRECECGRCSLPCSLKCAEGVLNAH